MARHLSVDALVVLAFAVLMGWAGCGGGPEPGEAELPAQGPTAHQFLEERLASGRTPLLAGDRYELPPTKRYRGLARTLRGSAHRLASGPIRLESDHPDAWVELTPLERANVPAVIEATSLVYPDAQRDTDVVVVLAKDRLEELRVLYTPAAPTVAHYRVRTGPAIRELHEHEGTVQAIDVHGRLAIRSLPAFAIDATGKKREVTVVLERRGHDRVARVSLDTRGLEHPIVVDPEWVPGPGWPSETIVALNSQWILGEVQDGSVAVLDEAPGVALHGGVELYVDSQGNIAGPASAHRITLLGNGEEMYCNFVDEQPCENPLALPLPITVPTVPAFDPGTQQPTDLSEIEPGSYGAVVIPNGEEARLVGGVYNFASLELISPSNLICDQECQIRIDGRLIMGEEHVVDTQGGGPGIELIVTGANAEPDQLDTPPLAVSTGGGLGGIGVYINARLYAPNGTVSIGSAVAWTGKIVARDVKLAAGSVVTDDLYPVEPNCTTHCQNILAAACSNGPPDLPTCVSECESYLTFGFCQYQAREMVNCLGTVSCNQEGEPTLPAACQSDFDTCLSVCSNVDDSDPCTIDYCTCTPDDCSIATSIKHTHAPYGQSCSDGDLCNGSEVCDGSGECLDGVPPNLDDGNSCTADSCNSQTGPVHTDLGPTTQCSDGDACNGTEFCDGSGSCQAGTGGPTVDDGNPSTIDTCDPATGVVTHTPIPTSPATGFDPSVASDIFDSTAFLYTGADPSQEGVTEVIEKERAAVVRGHVRGSSGNLAGVKVSILGRPGYGHTFTQGTGMFDMVVNGGERLTVVFEKEQYVTVHRTVNVGWHEYAFTDDVHMKNYDASVNPITLNASVMQVARGSAVSDAQGARQATLLVPPGTQATLQPSQTALSTMSVRLTEYTTGTDGPDAMPAGLPASTAYTYALELSADEAEQAGATSVTFSQPVILYVDNYLELSTGHSMPYGYYDRQTGQWVAESDGLIIKMLGVQNGLARLDLDGDDIEDVNSYADPVIDITEEERYHLAQLYTPGKTLWRVPLDHFTPGDLNCGFIRGLECAAGFGDCAPLEPPDSADPLDDPCTTSGSIIECQNQILGQRIPLTGTPYTLHYQSDRTIGYKAAYQLEIPLIGPSPSFQIPAGLQRVLVEVQVAGRREKWAAATCPGECTHDAVETWEWDGKDAWGRLVQGPQTAIVRVGYTFRRQWRTQATVVPNGSSGGGGGATPIELLLSFGSWPDSANFTTEATGDNWWEYAVWTTHTVPIGTWNSLKQGLGGFSIDVHHAYSPSQRVLYLGNGRRRSAALGDNLIDFFAGGGNSQDNGVPAITAKFGSPATGMDFGSDGTLYLAVMISAQGNHLVRRIAPDGTIHDVTNPNLAGSSCTSTGTDGSPAIQANLCGPEDVAMGTGGSLFVAEVDAYKIRRIDLASGQIFTFAGTGTSGSTGDGGIATQATLTEPRRVAVAPSGDVFILDNAKVRRVSTSNIITTVAGGASTHPSQFPTLASNLKLDTDFGDIAVGPDGSLYIADSADVVYRVWPDGYADIAAGQLNTPGASGDSGPATAATLQGPTTIHVGSDGAIYIGLNDVDATSNLQPGVRHVSSDGIITRLVGGEADGSCSPVCNVPGPATAAEFSSAGSQRLALAPNQDLYLFKGSRIYRVAPTLPGPTLGSLLLPSDDGSEVYVFDPSGRHLETRDALTGEDLYAFTYHAGGDLNGYLWKITDRDGLVTVINHDVDDRLASIVGPYGHATSFAAADGLSGFMTQVTMPLVPAIELGYSATLPGILTSFKYPRGNQKIYGYTDGTETHALAGLLEQTTDSLGTRTFARTNHTADDGWQVALDHAVAASNTAYDVTIHPDGGVSQTITRPDGVATTSVRGTDGITTAELHDDTTISLVETADPRFDMMAPVPAQLTITTGSPTKTLDVRTTRAVTLTAPGTDPLAVESWTETVCVNGAVSGTSCDTASDGGLTTHFDATANTITRTTHALREAITQLDANGRPINVQIASSMINLADVDLTYNDGTLDPLKKGQLETVTYSFGTEARTYTLGHDTNGNLTSIQDPLSRTTTFTPDGATRITTQIFPDSNSVGFGHDDNDNVTSLDPPGDGASNQHAFLFNGVDLLDKYTAPSVGLSSHDDKYAYNGDAQLDLLTLNHLGNASTIDPIYDGFGRLDEIDITAYGGTLWMLDYNYHTTDPDKGKLKEILSSKDNVTLTFGYDGLLLDQVTWSGTGMPTTVSVTHGYDNAFRMTSETVSGQTAVTFAYNDDDGLLTAAGALTLTRDPDTGIITGTSITDSSATVTDVVAVNPFGELDGYTATRSTTTLYDVDFTLRDAIGRVVNKTETVLGSVTHYGYVYDLAGRLDKVYEGSTQPCSNPPSTNCTLVADYAYDENGNRNPTACNYDLQDRLTACGTTSYLYTEWGALAQKTVSSAVTTYEYDLLGNLREVTPPTPAQPIEYLLDGLGRRVGRKVGGTLEQLWVYRDALNPVAQLTGTGTVDAIFVYGTKAHVPDYMVKGGSLYRFITDHLGSVRLVVKVSDGTIAQKWDYDEWGIATFDDPTSTEPIDFQPFGFAGGLYDPITGLVRFGARDYDPAVGRWTAKDPISFEGGQANLYEYVGGDPINRTDSTGTAIDAFTLLDVYDLVRGIQRIAAGCATTMDYVTTTLAAVGVVTPFVGGLGHVWSKSARRWRDPVTGRFTKPPQFPGHDPTVVPPGFEWRGKPGSLPGSKHGNYYNKKTGSSYHPDLAHPPPIGPHWDYRDAAGNWWRIMPDGTVVPK